MQKGDFIVTRTIVFRQLMPVSIGLLLTSSVVFSPLSVRSQSRVDRPAEFKSGFRSEFKLAQTFEPPPDSATPMSTTGGGRRDAGKCRETETPNQPEGDRHSLDRLLVALIPPSNVGLTLAERPTFFFYVPKTSAKTAEFILEDTNLNRLATLKLNLRETPAVYSLTPVATDLPLSLDKDYQWVFSLVCGKEGDLRDPIVSGRIRRIQPSPVLVSKLEKASALERAKLFAAAGIWYEAAATLATLQKTHPQDPQLSAAWGELLRSVGLAPISSASIKTSAKTDR